MKKFLACIFISVMLIVVFSACSGGAQAMTTPVGIAVPTVEPAQPVSPEAAEPIEPTASTEPADGMPLFRVAALRGPTAMGLLHLMRQHDTGETMLDYDFTLLGSPAEVPPLLVQSVVDMAAVPGNLASILYNQLDGDVQAMAVVTLGVLHIVDLTGEINTVADLRGRTIFATGQGATPEFALNYVLTQNGLSPSADVTIEFRAEAPEIGALLQAGQAEIALLPEPFISTILTQVDGLRVALDLTEEWHSIQPDYSLIMSILIGRRAFLEAHPAAVQAFMEEYASSINFMTTELSEAAQLAVDFGLIPNPVIAEAALPGTNIVFITGDDMVRHVNGFLGVLYESAPQSVGGRLPSNDFFFMP